MPSVSIIIPCYNSENYLVECLNSILNQTFQDFEVLLINDGSSDSTGAIIDRISARDKRFKAIHKTNGGVSSARNEGLRAVTGEWVCFVDSDDALKPDGLETMMSLTGDDCDIVFAGFEIYKNQCLFNTIPPLREAKVSRFELVKELFTPSDYHYQGYICSKLYKREIIEEYGIRFDEEIIYNEDRLFTLSFLSHARKGTYTTKPVYEYLLNDGNAMSNIESGNYWKFETDLDAYIKMNNIIAEFGMEDLIKAVQLQTYNSYLRNKHLNKKYGHNDRLSNKRLKLKVRSILSAHRFMSLTIGHQTSVLKALAYKHLVRIAKI